MKNKISQSERILCFLYNKKTATPIFQIIEWGLENYIVDVKRLLPKMAETKLVVGQYKNNKHYKYWAITNIGRRFIKGRIKALFGKGIEPNTRALNYMLKLDFKVGGTI